MTTLANKKKSLVNQIACSTRKYFKLRNNAYKSKHLQYEAILLYL